MFLTGSHQSPEGAKPRVRPQVDHRTGSYDTAQGPRGQRWTWSHGGQGRWHLCAPFPPSCSPLSSPCSVAQKADPNSLDQRGPTPSPLLSPSNPQLTGDWGQQGAQLGTREREAERKGKEENELGHLFSSSLPVGHLRRAGGLRR